MQDTYQHSDSIQTDSVHVTENQNVSATTVAIPKKERDKSNDVNSAIQVTGIGMLGIFVFMFIFFLVIKGIDKLFPGAPAK